MTFFIGFFVGGILGFVVASFLFAAHDDEWEE